MGRSNRTRVTTDKHGCLLCKIRRKRCPEPQSGRPCSECGRLQLHCSQCYGPGTPVWLDESAKKRVMATIRDWTMRRSYQRATKQSPPDLQDLFLRLQQEFEGVQMAPPEQPVSPPSTNHIPWSISLAPAFPSPQFSTGAPITVDDNYRINGQNEATRMLHLDLGALDVLGASDSSRLHFGSPWMGGAVLMPPAEHYVQQHPFEAALPPDNIRSSDSMGLTSTSHSGSNFAIGTPSPQFMLLQPPLQGRRHAPSPVSVPGPTPEPYREGQAGPGPSTQANRSLSRRQMRYFPNQSARLYSILSVDEPPCLMP
ncbi:uncharacterized protein EI90DRAFT_1680085 [Cantharellus anzutake]|uniref:uncharacterized protein n=1 Tax=Cantharellus anzutake TaxID=1750568 RepID=UPI001903047C|nr:uncharacterized protein EI90DRAFT_1680085 [Cantharellus anzutake]KAF8327751.1 hypothetical protein EI90DRAFT_1680085 [Cantharellus anzutake]